MSLAKSAMESSCGPERNRCRSHARQLRPASGVKHQVRAHRSDDGRPFYVHLSRRNADEAQYRAIHVLANQRMRIFIPPWIAEKYLLEFPRLWRPGKISGVAASLARWTLWNRAATAEHVFSGQSAYKVHHNCMKTIGHREVTAGHRER